DKVSSSWLASHVSESEVRDWLKTFARLNHNAAFKAPDDAAKPPAFSSVLISATYGDARAETLFNNADAAYLLSFRDGGEVPGPNRADVAILLRDGMLSLSADTPLRPKQTMTRL